MFGYVYKSLNWKNSLKLILDIGLKSEIYSYNDKYLEKLKNNYDVQYYPVEEEYKDEFIKRIKQIKPIKVKESTLVPSKVHSKKCFQATRFDYSLEIRDKNILN